MDLKISLRRSIKEMVEAELLIVDSEAAKPRRRNHMNRRDRVRQVKGDGNVAQTYSNHFHKMQGSAV